jgi:hypothetical protein
MSINRNAPCPCGSGRKYKNCHAAKASLGERAGLSGKLIVLLIVAVAIVAALAITRGGGGSGGAPGPAPPGKVWSTEHGHWHDAP